MEQPTMFDTRQVADDTQALVSWIPVPGLGVLPVNSYLIRAKEPVLIDTGVAAVRDDYMRTLREAIDPEDLRWIFLTHTDPDHVGNLQAVLDAAPQARVVTTYLGLGKLGLLGFEIDKVFLLNPGQSLDVGGRSLLALKPPTFDAPETTGLYDPATGALFSADSFGALLESPAADAAAIPDAALREGMIGWSTVDAPWLAHVAGSTWSSVLASVRELAPEVILSAHLPVAAGSLRERLLGYLEDARTAPAFVGPDQAALEQMMSAVA